MSEYLLLCKLYMAYAFVSKQYKQIYNQIPNISYKNFFHMSIITHKNVFVNIAINNDSNNFSG